METFFAIFKKSMVATVFVIFALVTVYTPYQYQQTNTVETAEAFDIVFDPTIFANAISQLSELLGINIATTLSAGYNAITSFATNSLYFKEYVLDGIAWAIAKTIISAMVQTLVNWINSGFNGSPAFVQNLLGHLREQADQAVDLYIKELGASNSYICAPFRLNVQVAVATQYQLSRIDQPAPTCQLDGKIDDIEGFLSGAQGSFLRGGWDDWFDITSQPDVYTPYGAVLSGQRGTHSQIINTKGEATSLLNFGGGFLSGEICNIVHGSEVPKEECFISKPGKIIQEALSFNLDSPRQSLIVADEIDEIIGELFSQLANTAITGVSGLLGLSGGTGYTYSGFSGGSYLDQMTSNQGQQGGTNTSTIQSSLDVQISFNNLAKQYKPLLQAELADLQTITDPDSQTKSKINSIIQQLSEIDVIIPDTNSDITTLNSIITELSNPNTTPERVSQLYVQFSSLSLYSSDQVNIKKSLWASLI